MCFHLTTLNQYLINETIFQNIMILNMEENNEEENNQTCHQHWVETELYYGVTIMLVGLLLFGIVWYLFIQLIISFAPRE